MFYFTEKLAINCVRNFAQAFQKTDVRAPVRNNSRDVALTIRLLQLFCFVIMLVITMFNCFRGRRGGRHRAGAGGAGPRPRAGPAVGLVATARRAAATAPRLYYRQRHTAVATAKQQSCRTGKYTFQTFELEKLQ